MAGTAALAAICGAVCSDAGGRRWLWESKTRSEQTLNLVYVRRRRRRRRLLRASQGLGRCSRDCALRLDCALRPGFGLRLGVAVGTRRCSRLLVAVRQAFVATVVRVEELCRPTETRERAVETPRQTQCRGPVSGSVGPSHCRAAHRFQPALAHPRAHLPSPPSPPPLRPGW